MARIFFSYRRQDTKWVIATLKDRIKRKFGKGSVFVDTDDIPVGKDFRKEIETAVSKSHAMLVVIGDKWLTNTGENRLFKKTDPVRMEIEIALARRIVIIPVLVEGVEMPGPEDLPEEIREFHGLNAAAVSAGRDLDGHMSRLIDDLTRALKSKSTKRKHRSVIPSQTAQRAAEQVVKTKKKLVTQQGRRQKAISALPRLTLKSVRRAFRYSSDIYFGSQIPPNKLHNALQTYAPDLEPDDVIALYDNTVFGGAKQGFLLTKTAIYWHNDGEEPDHLDLQDVVRVTHTAGNYEAVVRVNGRPITLATAAICDDNLAALLKEMIRENRKSGSATGKRPGR